MDQAQLALPFADKIALPFADKIHKIKYRSGNETFEESMWRLARELSDSEEQEANLYYILLNQRFLPGGRIQAAIGSGRNITALNCYVMDTIPDSLDGIMRVASEAAETLKRGGGVGFDFSTLRPRNSEIISMKTESSGPVSFMEIFDAICGTIKSAGWRRGAMMGVMSVEHPDILEFVRAKQNSTRLTNFNISVSVPDKFIEAVRKDLFWDFKFQGGNQYDGSMRAREVWDIIMESAWDYGEPGVIFIDHINKYNNLWYCEDIQATNPCGEQPLPPYGACALGSFNLPAYIVRSSDGSWVFNHAQFLADIPSVVRMMDNMLDKAIYPLDQQREESLNKRRLGLGFTGVANALEALGSPYGSPDFIVALEGFYSDLANEAYRASAELAKEKGAFPAYDRGAYLQSHYITERIDPLVQTQIKNWGIRNSHLISQAPAGTISLGAGNVSSGIEPVWAYEYYRRDLDKYTEAVPELLTDYGWRVFGVKGKLAKDCSPLVHLNVLDVASRYCDSGVSKTINVSGDCDFDLFKNIYMEAWLGTSVKGCTAFRIDGEREGVMVDEEAERNGGACTIDPTNGKKSCD